MTFCDTPEAVVLGAIALELEQDPDIITTLYGPTQLSSCIPYDFLEIVCTCQNTCKISTIWITIVDGVLLATTTSSWQDAKSRFSLSDPTSLDKFHDLIRKLKQ